MKVLVTLICLFMLFACSSTDKVSPDYTFKESYSYAELVALHRSQSSTPTGYQYESSVLVPEHNKYWSSVAKKCRPLLDREGISLLEFIFVIDDSGNVISTRSQNSGEAATCFLNGVKQITYPSPPYEYWYELVTVR